MRLSLEDRGSVRRLFRRSRVLTNSQEETIVVGRSPPLAQWEASGVLFALAAAVLVAWGASVLVQPRSSIGNELVGVLFLFLLFVGLGLVVGVVGMVIIPERVEASDAGLRLSFRWPHRQKTLARRELAAVQVIPPLLRGRRRDMASLKITMAGGVRTIVVKLPTTDAERLAKAFPPGRFG